MNRLLIAMIFLLAAAPCASATISDFGFHKIGTDITLYQVCSACTYNNLTVISPTSNILISNQEMTIDGYQFTYNLTGGNLSEIGQYKVHGMGDDGGVDAFWSYTFDVTKTGYTSEKTDFMLIIAALFGVVAILLALAAVLHSEHGILALLFAGIGFYILNPIIQTANMAVQNNYIDAGMSGMIDAIMSILTWLDYVLIVYIIIYIFVKVISNYNTEKAVKMEGLR